MIVRLPLLVLALGAASVATGQASKVDRAKAFTLDTVAPDPTATPSPAATRTEGGAAAADASPVLAAPPVPDNAAVTASPSDSALRPSFTIETPIAVLIADPAARAVLDRDLPGLSTDDNLDKFAKLGLREFQPLTGGQLTDKILLKVARDLATLGGPIVAPITPAAGGTSKRNNDASR